MAPELRLVESGTGDEAPGSTPGCTASERMPLTPEEELRVRTGLSLVKRCAEEVAGGYQRYVTWQELMAVGLFALRRAARLFRDEAYSDFPVYARHSIRGRMIDAVRRDHFSYSERIERAMDRAHDVFWAHEDVEIDTFSDPEEKLIEGAKGGCDDGLAAAIVAAAHEAQAAGPEAALIDRIAVRQAREALPPADREVVRLVHDEEKTLDEVAAELGVSPTTAQRRGRRGLRRLRDLLLG
jgi:RNA polymerase sigma factor (sigma-70 family)